MISTAKLPPFDIRNFIDRLQPTKQRNKYICPVCSGNNLGIEPHPETGQPPAYCCFSGGCDSRDIREAISPLTEALQLTGQDFTYRKQVNKVQKSKKQALRLAQLPESITLAKFLVPITNTPKNTQRIDRERGSVRVTTYRYSETQWVERIEWDDSNHPKGHNKEFRQWHTAKQGEMIPVWKNGKRNGERLAQDGEAVCTKGEEIWQPYRLEEAITAVKATQANALLMGEGESVVETCGALGIACITLQGSAWGKAQLKLLTARLKVENITLIYLPDYDEPGDRKAQKVLETCTEDEVPCLILSPPGICSDLPIKGDVVDMVKLMGDGEFIQRLEAEIYRAVQERGDRGFTRQDQRQNSTMGGQTPAKIAAEIAESYRDRLAWNDEASVWYRYEAESSGVWSIESDTAIGSVVLAEFESRMGLNHKATWIEECIKILKWRMLVKKWEQPSKLIPFCNGVLDTQSGQLLPHAPGYRFTWTIPRNHNPLASDWRTIEEWMDLATGSSAKIKHILLCWLNACLKGRADLQRFLHLTGAGGTGKGTFIRLVISLIGKQNHHPSSLGDWCGNRFEPVNAYKKRLLAFADEDKYNGGLANFKKVTGGDALRGEVKRKQAFDFIFEGMVMIASNYPIFSGDTSSGIYRRLLMVPFNRIVPPHQRQNLDHKFEPELAALTNYVLSIPDDVVSQTLRQSVDSAPELIERTWDWRMRLDNVAAWLNECVIRDREATERVGNDKEDVETLFGSYYRYCEQTGSRPKGSREFSPALLELVNNEPALNWGIEKKRFAGGFMIHGLRLRKSKDVNQPYCLEALADVGSTSNVGSSVESDVGSKPLPQARYVGCVESTNLKPEIFDLNTETNSAAPHSKNYYKEEATSYIPYTNQSQQASSTLHSHPTVQGDSSYTELELLTPDELKQALQAMNQINSVESSGKFYERYSKCSQAQKLQIMQAATVQPLDGEVHKIENITPLVAPAPSTNQSAENFASKEQHLASDLTNKSSVLPVGQDLSLALLQCQTWIEIVEKVQKNSEKLVEYLNPMDKFQKRKITSLLIHHLCQEPQYLSQLAWLPAKMLRWVMKQLTFSIERIGGPSIDDVQVEVVENLSFVAVDYLGTPNERWILSPVSGANIPVFGTESIYGIAAKPRL
jgi:putative DNA primase/helicase